MSCLLMRRNCKVCGKPHDFFLCGEELNTNERYEYRCPERGLNEYLWEIVKVESVPEPPPGAVEIRPTHHPSERR
jgi:hypothetical protein